MIKKYLFMTIATLLCCSIAWGQYSAPEAGKAYRILTPGKNYDCMSADYKQNMIKTMPKGTNAYEQMWVLEAADGGAFYVKNGLTGNYVQPVSQLSGFFRMEESPAKFYIKENQPNKGFYNLLPAANETRGMHSSPFNEVVLWYSSTTAGTLSATEWVFEDAGISINELAEIQETFRNQQNISQNAEKYNQMLSTFFTDRSCSELKADYASMGDAELTEAMKEFPKTIVDMALKIKNNTWGKREKEFRISEYKPYANADEWHKILQANEYSYLSNPTGIYARANEMLYVFVDGEIAEGAFLGIQEIVNTETSGVIDTLRVGLNIIPVSFDMSTIFVRYDVNTHNSGKVLADYPNIKIHIENGTVNGYWDKSRHTDEDWRDITQNLATHHVIQVKGDRVLYHMEKKWLAAENCCKNTITDAIGWWDNMLKWDHELLGWDKGIYGVKFNNLHCAISLDDDHTYQASTAYRTQYGVRYLYKLLPYNVVMDNHDNVWGPGHELGHTHQGSIQVIGTTELSCNLFANLTMYKMGRFISRGDTIGTLSRDFAQSKPWTSMLGESRMRMWWQLYEYFHMAGVDTDFYPKLFALLREDGIDTSPTHVLGNKDILHFAVKCCEAANMDLSEYFKVWGFFRPIHQLTDKEAAWKDLTVTQEMIDNALATMKAFSRKAPAIEFIEDRIEPIARTDGGSGNKEPADFRVGQCGDVGHYTYYIPGEVPEATGHSYTKIGKTIIIEKGTGAVGFKVYNGKGEYKAMSNTLKFTIPEALAADPGIKIVAAEGDGDEVVLKPYAETGAEAELNALKYALKTIAYYTQYTDKNGTKVGWYYPEKTARLAELKTEAQTAVDNADQSAHTYGEYLALIDEELSKIYTSNSVVKLQPKNYYNLITRSNSQNILSATASTFNVSKGGNASAAKMWQFITEDDSLYYIKNKSGFYIKSMLKNKAGTVTTNKDEAIKFRVVSMGNGYLYMEQDNIHGNCLAIKSDNTIQGQEYKTSYSWWTIRVAEDNQTEYDTQLLDSAITTAKEITTELLVAEELANGNYVLYDNILVKADNIIDLAKSLVAETTAAETVRAGESVQEYAEAAEKLFAAAAAAKAAYGIIPKYPASDISNGITWYYILNPANNKYLSVERTAKRYLNYVVHEDKPENGTDEYMMWAFIPTGAENEYYIFNAGSSCALYGSSYIEAMGGAEAVKYTLQLDTAQLGFTIAKGTSHFNGTATYPKMSSAKTYYKLEKAMKCDNALLAALNGEPYGRKPYGKQIADDSNLFVGGEQTAAFVDLKDCSDAALWIAKSKEKLTQSNTVYYTTLDAAAASAAGSNVVDKDGNCEQFDMYYGATYYVPEAFNAAGVSYTDINAETDDIRPLVLPFSPTNDITVAAPYQFGKIDGISTLTLAKSEFAANTPLFAVANGSSINATASNVTIEASSKEDMSTDYLLISYIGTSHKLNTYVKGSENKFNKATQAGTLAPFEINIKALPGASNSVSSISVIYDATVGIDSIESDDNGEKEIYDLTGRKIEKITAPGIYIVNKKKVIVK